MLILGARTFHTYLRTFQTYWKDIHWRKVFNYTCSDKAFERRSAFRVSITLSELSKVPIHLPLRNTLSTIVKVDGMISSKPSIPWSISMSTTGSSLVSELKIPVSEMFFTSPQSTPSDVCTGHTLAQYEKFLHNPPKKTTVNKTRPVQYLDFPDCSPYTEWNFLSGVRPYNISLVVLLTESILSFHL